MKYTITPSANFILEAYLRYHLNKKEEISIQVAKIAHKHLHVNPLARPSPDLLKPGFFNKAETLYPVLADLSSYMMKNIKYVSDPGGGLFDYYTHPDALQQMVDHHTQTYASDCDDFAVYAYASLRKSGVPEDYLQVVTIIPKIFPEIWNIRWAHVICVIKNPKAELLYSIDTNGLNSYNYKEGHQGILNKFAQIYKVPYMYYVHHDYPFGVLDEKTT